MSPPPSSGSAAGAEWWDDLWHGFQTGAADMLLSNFFTGCEACGGHCAPRAAPLDTGDLVKVLDDQHGEVVEVDTSRDLFPVLVRTRDGAMRWFSEAKVQRLRLKAQQAEKLREELACIHPEYEEVAAPRTTSSPAGGPAARSPFRSSPRLAQTFPCGGTGWEDPTCAEERIQAAVQDLGVDDGIPDVLPNVLVLPLRVMSNATMALMAAASPRCDSDASVDDSSEKEMDGETVLRDVRFKAALAELGLGDIAAPSWTNDCQPCGAPQIASARAAVQKAGGHDAGVFGGQATDERRTRAPQRLELGAAAGPAAPGAPARRVAATTPEPPALALALQLRETSPCSRSCSFDLEESTIKSFCSKYLPDIDASSSFSSERSDVELD